PPRFLGTRLNIVGGYGTAGIALGVNSSMNGIFIELGTTERIEALGRKRNELTLYVKNGISRNYVGNLKGTLHPVSKGKFYTIDVVYQDGARVPTTYSYAAYEGITLKYGSRGNAVKALQNGLNKLWGARLTVDGV